MDTKLARSLRRSVSVLLLTLVVSSAWAEDKLPELDIVVTSKMKTTKEHLDAFLGKLLQDLSGTWVSLSPKVWTPGEKVEDGAAKYRLVLEHTGTVAIGNEIKSMRRSGGQAAGGVWTRDWLLEGHLQGSFQAKLLQWQDDKYKEIDKWTFPAPKSDAEVECGGMWRVASKSGDNALGKKAGTDVDQSPVTLEQAKPIVLQSLQPGSIREPMLNHFFKFTISKAAKSKQDPNAIDATVTVKNGTPWDTERIDATVAYQNVLLGVSTTIGTADQDPAQADPGVPAGKEKAFKLSTRQLPPKVPVGITTVQFKIAQ